jgi:thymidylate kinase
VFRLPRRTSALMTLPRQPNEVSRFSHPPGLVVVLCGPDGCGKSTIASSIINRLSAAFSPKESLHCHWKPWPGNRRTHHDAAVIRPHEQQLRNPVASFCYFCYHWLGFLSGMLFNVPRFTRRGGLVVIERFYYDFFVDLRRYRLRLPQSIVRCGYRMLPKPDLVFLLDAPAEKLHQRKQEVPLAETARQRDSYRKLVSALSNGRIIDATLPEEAVTQLIVEQILQFRAQRMNSRLSVARSGPIPAPGDVTASRSPERRKV